MAAQRPLGSVRLSFSLTGEAWTSSWRLGLVTFLNRHMLGGGGGTKPVVKGWKPRPALTHVLNRKVGPV